VRWSWNEAREYCEAATVSGLTRVERFIRRPIGPRNREAKGFWGKAREVFWVTLD
jgi:hypothetical protein